MKALKKIDSRDVGEGTGKKQRSRYSFVMSNACQAKGNVEERERERTTYEIGIYERSKSIKRSLENHENSRKNYIAIVARLTYTHRASKYRRCQSLIL